MQNTYRDREQTKSDLRATIEIIEQRLYELSEINRNRVRTIYTKFVLYACLLVLRGGELAI